MSWTNFSLYLAFAYAVYYALNFLIDFSRAGRYSLTEGDEAEEHYQIEDIQQPVEVSAFSQIDNLESSGDSFLSSGELESSGALRFEQIMQAASQELIECTKRML